MAEKVGGLDESSFAAKDKNADIFEQLKKMDRSQIINDITKPSNMSLSITIENPIIQLKPNPSSQDYLMVDLGKITVTNLLE